VLQTGAGRSAVSRIERQDMALATSMLTPEMSDMNTELTPAPERRCPQLEARQ